MQTYGHSIFGNPVVSGDGKIPQVPTLDTVSLDAPKAIPSVVGMTPLHVEGRSLRGLGRIGGRGYLSHDDVDQAAAGFGFVGMFGDASGSGGLVPIPADLPGINIGGYRTRTKNYGRSIFDGRVPFGAMEMPSTTTLMYAGAGALAIVAGIFAYKKFAKK